VLGVPVEGPMVDIVPVRAMTSASTLQRSRGIMYKWVKAGLNNVYVLNFHFPLLFLHRASIGKVEFILRLSVSLSLSPSRKAVVIVDRIA
jgi:hypothetical protein